MSELTDEEDIPSIVPEGDTDEAESCVEGQNVTVSTTVVGITDCCAQVIIVSGETVWVSVFVTTGQEDFGSISRSLDVVAENVDDDVESSGLFSTLATFDSEITSVMSVIMDDWNVGQEVAGGTWF